MFVKLPLEAEIAAWTSFLDLQRRRGLKKFRPRRKTELENRLVQRIPMTSYYLRRFNVAVECSFRHDYRPGRGERLSTGRE